MAKKGQKFNTYTLAEKHEILNYAKMTSQREAARKFNIAKGTIGTWQYKLKHRGTIDNLRRGREKDSDFDYKERYEILKKYLEFCKNQKL